MNGLGKPNSQAPMPTARPRQTLMAVTVATYLPRYSSSSFVIRMKRSLASRLVKNDTTYRRKSICVARKKIRVTKNSVSSIAGANVPYVDAAESVAGILGFFAYIAGFTSIVGSLLAARMQQHGTRVWLVNTGWSGGPYGTGQRIKLRYTRAILDAIHSGVLAQTKRQPDPEP